jgi:hypothetical protein
MREANGVRLTAHQRTWLERIKDCEASGMSVSAYAAAHGLQVRTMYDAKKVLVKKGVLPRTHQTRFQRVRINSETASTEWRVCLPNGASVSFSGAVEAGSLLMVLSTVAAVG